MPQNFHLIDFVAAIVGVIVAAIFRPRIRYAASRIVLLARRRASSTADRLFGQPTRIVGPKSLPFYVMVKMPEGDYLAIVTFRHYVYGRARGRKRVEVRAHIVMDPGQQIPLPPPTRGERDAGDAVYSLLVPHADSLDDAAAQVARYVTGIRLRRAGWRWTPTEKHAEKSYDDRD